LLTFPFVSRRLLNPPLKAYDQGCVAHSDGDVIYHSVVDAILGALSLPDIGQLFPDNDPRLKGSNSEVLQ